MREVYRILDANLNRAREALRVSEDCGRFALNDPAITAMAKNLRSDLKEVLDDLPVEEMLISRDTPGDLGTEITSPSEPRRKDLADVAVAACKRLTEALRTVEEYCKFVAPQQVLKIERMRYNAYTLEQRLVSRLYTGRKLESCRLYGLLTSIMCTGCIRDKTRAAISGGADLIQLREKNVGDAFFLALAAELREMTDETGRIFIVNDRPDIAALVGADGVHLGQDDIPVVEARKLLRPGAVVGKSTHSYEHALAAVNEGADYIAIGPLFDTNTKKAGPQVSPEVVRKITEDVTVPIFGIGGITADNMDKVVAMGLKRVAVSSGICQAEDPAAAAAAIRGALAWQQQNAQEE
ncbi:MAG: thiamine phosphate synthase [Phycisphaerae bacterium]